MGSFTVISSGDIDRALAGATRQYLAGNLQRPQPLAFVPDERLELGLTVYTTPTPEQPHRHSEATEFQYVLAGLTEYLDLDDGAVHRFRTGDFYVIHPGTSYAQRSKAGTRILFVKVPSIDDKVVLEAAPDVRRWMDEHLRVTRTDYSHDPGAPTANSLRPAAAAAITDGHGRLLVLRRRDSGTWTMPGGTLDMGESLAECVVREVREESGLVVQLTGIVGTYSDPQVRVAYSDGEVRQEFTVVYATRTVGGELRLDEESTEYRWVDLDQVGDLPLADSQRRRLADVGTYLAAGTQHCG